MAPRVRSSEAVDNPGAAHVRAEDEEGDDVAKKAILLLIVAFAIYSVLATPRDAADAVRTAGTGLQSAAGSLIEFFQALTP